MKLILSIAAVILMAISASAQPNSKPANPASTEPNIRSTPAYAEVLLRKTELTAELESLLMTYTEEYPKVVDLRRELEVLKPEIDRLFTVKTGDSGKLTTALGRLILGKVSHAAELKKLQTQFQDAHPDVKKEKRMVEIYEAAIKEILG
jgi:hypothetical protein